MNTKEFFKMILRRYGSVGLSLMGLYNIALLVLRFTHKLDAMPENITLYQTDILLVSGVILTGLVLEALCCIWHKIGGTKKEVRGASDTEKN